MDFTWAVFYKNGPILVMLFSSCTRPGLPASPGLVILKRLRKNLSIFSKHTGSDKRAPLN